MADDIVVDVKFRGNGPDFLAELSRAVGNAKEQLQAMGQSTAAMSRLETQLARMSQTARQAAQATTAASNATLGWSQRWTPFKGQFQAAEASSNSLWRSIDAGFTQADRSIARATATLNKFNTEQQQSIQARVGGNAMADWDKQFAAASAAADKNAEAVRRAKKAIDDYQNSLSNTRYVLYDVAGTLSIMGVGLVAPLAAAVGVAANMELAFAQVARTSGVLGDELAALKEEFDALYGSIPITYDELAKIATLAGQLGVPASQIAQFTEVVAMTATVTDLSVDAAATAFGRLNALIPNVQGQFDRLGSSIAKVGVNSVATESEIVNIATQISSMGSFAGLTAQDIIGLSGALASIGAQPELSRGTVTRVFTLMSRAVAEGGDSLERFASLSGVSADEFKTSWGTPAFTQTFLGFMQGIQSEGGNAVATLNELGITSVRDVPLLLRLANAADTTGKAGALLAQTIGDSNSGWAENIELQRQYEIISQTVAKRFEVLVNNLNLLLQAVGGPMLEGLGEFLSFLTDITAMTTEFAQSDLGGAIVRVTVVLGALLGVLAIAGGAMALFGASSIGIYQALQFVSTASPRAAAALLGTASAAALADGSMKAGAASAVLLGRALRAITIVGAIALLPDIMGALNKEFQKMRGVDLGSASGALKEIAQSADPLASYFRTNGSIAQSFASDITNSFTGVGVMVKSANEALRQMATEGNFSQIADELNTFNRAATDIDATRTLELFPDIVAAAKEAGVELKVVGDEIVVVGRKGNEASSGTESIATSMDVAAEAAQEATKSLEEYKAALDAINGTVIGAAEASDRLQSAINSAWEAVAAGDVTIDGTNNQSIRFRDTLREIESSARTAGEAILTNGGSVEEAAAKWDQGRGEIVLLLQEMGKSPAEAQAMADAMFGTRDQMLLAFRAISAGIAAVPASKTITLVADTAPAYAAVERFVWDNNGRRINFYVDGYAGRQVAGSSLIDKARAAGGPVFGPGTATSDSIITALSNGEYVLRTRAAQAIGYARLDYMNRTGKLPGFANGGTVGGAQSAPIFPGSMVVELSARDRALLARIPEGLRLQVGGRVLAEVTNGANFSANQRGAN